MNLKLTDAHLHLWNINKLIYPWLEEVPDINKTFDLETFQLETEDLYLEQEKKKLQHEVKDSLLAIENIRINSLQLEKLVFIQCECLATQYLDEVNYVTNLATQDNRIQGIISWFPLESERAEEYLQNLIQNPLIKGVRRLEESPTSLFKNPDFIKNLNLLSKYNLTFDICAKNYLLGSAIQMVEKKPEVKYMLDHMGKPDIKNEKTISWKNNIRLLAQNPNVYCKVSGLVTEADLHNWHPDQLRPYFEYVLEQFGIDRLVFGGDWPVLTLAASYQKWINTILSLCNDFSEEDLNKFFNENANQFYKLS